MKKFTKLIILILLIVIVAIIAFFLYFNSNNYTKEKVISLLQKGAKYNNYSIELSNDNQSLTLKQKDNIYVVTSSKENEETFKIYENFDLDEIIIMDEEYAIKSSISKYIQNEEETEYLQPYINTAIENFKSDDYEYSYVEKTKYNKENCIVVNLKKDSDKYENTNYTINPKTGLIYKIESFNKNNKVIESTNLNITLNSVTDEDIQKPDLTNINVFEI